MASYEINFGFKSQFMANSTSENVGGNFDSLGGRFHRNGRIRPIGRLMVTFLIGHLGINQKNSFALNWIFGQAVPIPSKIIVSKRRDFVSSYQIGCQVLREKYFRTFSLGSLKF